jgi:hypothetical protein
VLVTLDQEQAQLSSCLGSMWLARSDEEEEEEEEEKEDLIRYRSF